MCFPSILLSLPLPLQDLLVVRVSLESRIPHFHQILQPAETRAFPVEVEPLLPLESPVSLDCLDVQVCS